MNAPQLTPQHQAAEDPHLTIRDLAAAFEVTEATVSNWRKGSTRITKLPAHITERGTRTGVYFLKSEVEEWALHNKITRYNPFPSSRSKPSRMRAQNNAKNG